MTRRSTTRPTTSSWEPRYPLTAAEERVDYPAHLAEIIDRRARVERAATPVARRLAFLLADLGYVPVRSAESLSARVLNELAATARFGYREAQREIAAARKNDERSLKVLSYSVPDAGRHGRLAREGFGGIMRLLRTRAAVATHATIAAAAAAHREEQARLDPDPVLAAAAVAAAAAKTLHRHVLELVGEALNLGRTAGALRYPTSRGGPPEFALRSEQLDKRTCAACDGLHGTTVRVGSSAYYDYLPPSGCLGGGRCRAIMVYADGEQDTRGPDTDPGPQPPLPPLGPDL